MSDSFDSDDLKKASSKIQKQGKRQGLTDEELKKRKNSYWDFIFSCLSKGFVVMGGLILLAAFAVFCRYLWVICQDAKDLKTTVETAIKYMITMFVIPGINAVRSRGRR